MEPKALVLPSGILPSAGPPVKLCRTVSGKLARAASTIVIRHAQPINIAVDFMRHSGKDGSTYQPATRLSPNRNAQRAPIHLTAQAGEVWTRFSANYECRFKSATQSFGYCCQIVTHGIPRRPNSATPHASSGKSL